MAYEFELRAFAAVGLSEEKHLAGVLVALDDPDGICAFRETGAGVLEGIPKGSINAAWDAIGEVIKAWATEGHAVAVSGLGSMRFGLRSTSVADVKKVGTGLITSRRVIFTPSVDIKNELKATSISITCIDRDGNIVKRVTSTDDAEVEDPEDESSNQAPSGNQTQGTGDKTQGGNQSQTPPANNQGGGTQTGDNTQSCGSDDGGDVGNY